jgi:hypothetical protein
MVQSLEEYVAQATQAYQPAVDALQNQLNSLDSKLANTNEQINRSYNQQQADLNRSRNMAAESASMQAAGSGGSFGGSANLANRRYYDKTFVPAVTQLKTNQANDLASARQANDDLRNNINSQLANMQAQANQSALAQYYADQEAERNRALQRQQIASQNAYNQYLMDAMRNAQNSDGVKTWDFGNGYKVYDDNGEAIYSLNGNQISRGQFLEGTGKNTQWDLWNDIWNSGTRTSGVGSDTIQAYKDFYQPNAPRTTGNTISLSNSNKYGYLY